ncbi:MAG TPA: MmcQ/YjbR family DNA-binding protein [Candidatus Angelobacter sp.]|nr:MmcQ/YjbR family DNA-binding protein [Candidatus Angelobacter sp.]
MPTQDDVRRMSRALPEVTEEDGRFAVRVRGKAFAWVWLARPEPGARRIPDPDVLAVRVDGESEKETLIGMDPDVFFTEPHYDGFPAVLVRLPAIDAGLLEELLVRAWRIQAPKRLAATLDR